MAGIKGVRQGAAGKPGQCLVAGCTGKALYRVSRKREANDAGYCRKHRDVAVSRSRLRSVQDEFRLLRIIRGK